jgi:signal transduction histidine kinase
MNLDSISILLFSFGVLLVAVLALMKRKDRIALRFMFFSIAVCGWGFAEAVWFSRNYGMESTLLLCRISNAFAIWIPMTWFHFVLDFLGKKEPIKYFYSLNYAVALFLTSVSFTHFFIPGLHPILDFKYYGSAGPLYHLFTAVFFLLVPFGFTYLIRAYRSDANLREQLKYFIGATVIGFTAGSTTFLPVYKVPFPLFLLPLMILYPFLMGIGLIRYGLFDVQQIADAFQREKLTAIGIMAASLNHELRNPLYIAKGRMESYQDAAGRGIFSSLEDRQKNAEMVISSASQHLQRAMDIIQRFSDFAKPLNSHRDKERILLKDALYEVLELVSNEFEMQKIRLRHEPMDGISVYVNRRQLEEIFFNLIINACHAMNEKGGELLVKASQPNGKVIVEIADTGPGIADENQKRIFEPFFSTKGEKGSGLGLYITKQLVEKNGGKIAIKSKMGQGARFILTFPAK